VVAWVLPLGLTAALIFYFSFAGRHSGSRVTAVGDRNPANATVPDLASDSVAVLPFTNEGADASADYLCDGITESLIGDLARLPELKVRSRDAVFRLKGKELEVREAGNELGVSELVTGRVTVQASDIGVRAELTDVRDNTEIWGKQYIGKMSDLLQLQKQIAGDVAEALRTTLSPAEKEQVTRQGTMDPEAYTLYLKGRYAWNRRDRTRLEAAISFFNQSIERDPDYAMAYSGLADVYAVLPNFGGDPNEDFPRSNAAARKALELDPTLARPHAVLGANLTEYNWDFAGGEAEFRKAIALDPNDATAHQWYAEEIGQLGRHREAWAEINRAHDLDPLSPVITRVMGGTLLDAGQQDQAIEICRQLVQENPTFPIGHDCLYFAYWKKRMYSQAIEESTIESQLTGNPDDIELADAMERGFHSGGWNGALAHAVAVLEARRAKSYVSPFIIARDYADLGEKDKAFYWFDTALREHDRLLIGLCVSPGLDNVRSDPRFAELVRKVGLPPMQ
jgi:adenylate cyclase